jgi:hypothetical protein
MSSIVGFDNLPISLLENQIASALPSMKDPVKTILDCVVLFPTVLRVCRGFPYSYFFQGLCFWILLLMS